MGTKITIERGEAEWARVPVKSLYNGQLYETDADVIYLAHPDGLTRLDGTYTYGIHAYVRVRRVSRGTKITLEAE